MLIQYYLAAMISVKKAAVLGAGTMGAQIAAHLANAGVPTLLLDIVPRETETQPSANEAETRPSGRGPGRHKIARAGLAAPKKAKPPAFFTPARPAPVST